MMTNSSCGICGRVTIESLRTRASPLAITATIGRDAARALPARLRERQQLFDETGALHAAAVFDPGGRVLASAEDVGRHNAVDKVIGELLLEGVFRSAVMRSPSAVVRRMKSFRRPGWPGSS